MVIEIMNQFHHIAVKWKSQRSP